MHLNRPTNSHRRNFINPHPSALLSPLLSVNLCITLYKCHYHTITFNTCTFLSCSLVQWRKNKNPNMIVYVILLIPNLKLLKEG